MKLNFKKIVIAAVLPAGMFCSEAAAEEFSSEGKIKIIDEIVAEQIKEAKGGDALDAVLDAVAAKFPLDPDENSPESAAFIKELEQQTQKKYPISDKSLEAQYSRIAERDYPIYKVGDNITVVYRLYGKTFTVSGPYHRQDSKFVWVGSKKINKLDLERECAKGFDPVEAKLNRENFVRRQVFSYRQAKIKYLLSLKQKNADKLCELRGNIRYGQQWLPARKVVMEKYAAAFALQDNLIAEAVKKAENSSDYNEMCKILEAVIRQYPNYKSLSSIENLLQKMKGEYKRKQEIRQELQGIWRLQFSEKRPQWQSISKSHYAVDQALDKVRELQGQASYDQAIAEVEKIISREPRISASRGAQDLLQTLKQQREAVQQEQGRLAESREAVKKLSIDDSSQRAQIVIRKKINVSAGAAVFIFPLERKKEILELHNIINNILSNYLSYKKHYSEGKRLADAGSRTNVTGISSFNESSNLLDQAENHMKQAQTALQLFEKYHNEAKNILLQITSCFEDTVQRRQRVIQLKSDPCTLSDIQGPIILFAFEKFNFRAPNFDYDSFQSWYMEYTPTSQTVNWDLK